jgi:hypothetical protein
MKLPIHRLVRKRDEFTTLTGMDPMRGSRIVALGTLTGTLLAAGCARGSHGDQSAWTWRGDVGSGGWVHVRNTTGAIRIDRATGSQVEAVATRQWHGRRPEDVHFAAVRNGQDVSLCALWGSNGACDSSHHRSDRRAWWRRLFFPRNRVSVDFVVHVPQGVKVDASSINGPIAVDGATTDVTAQTVNGPIRAHTARGALHAETVNGPITAAVDSLAAGGGDISLQTVNGPVTAELPDSLDAEVAMSTVNGRIVTDYPLTLSGGTRRFGPKEVRAVIGHGGRRISLETINGNATLKKRM